MATTTRKISCRFCRGMRPTNGKVCLGCGAPVASAEIKPRPRKKPPRQCPKCSSKDYRTTEPQRFQCQNPLCMAVFEDLEFEFLDTRGEQNLIKREEQRQRKSEEIKQRRGRLWSV